MNDFPSHATASARFALSRQKFGVRELPDDIDDVGNLTLVLRLIQKGLLMVLGA